MQKVFHNMNFSNTLVSWYIRHKRELPWRSTKDPYRIWLSEIILQQTRMEQGIPYYLKFLKTFPNVFVLADSSQEEVLKLWQGLGYYSRARNLHSTGIHVVNELDGVFPDSYKELLKLKGIGDYTASAIASICFNEAVAVVDGNVYRVLSRIFGINTPINLSGGQKEFKNLAQHLLDQDRPSDFNQGLMEFGSLQCKPQLPECGTCPFSGRCVAYNQGRISELPVKLKKKKVKKRHFNYLVFISEKRETLLKERKGKGIWQGLFEFPLVETTGNVEKGNLVQEENFQAYADEGTEMSLYNHDPIVHRLSHQHIYAKFWVLTCKELPEKGVPLKKLQDFPVPVLIGRFIERLAL